MKKILGFIMMAVVCSVAFGSSVIEDGVKVSFEKVATLPEVAHDISDNYAVGNVGWWDEEEEKGYSVAYRHNLHTDTTEHSNYVNVLHSSTNEGIVTNNKGDAMFLIEHRFMFDEFVYWDKNGTETVLIDMRKKLNQHMKDFGQEFLPKVPKHTITSMNERGDVTGVSNAFEPIKHPWVRYKNGDIVFLENPTGQVMEAPGAVTTTILNNGTVVGYVLDVDSNGVQRTYPAVWDKNGKIRVGKEEGKIRSVNPSMIAVGEGIVDTVSGRKSEGFKYDLDNNFKSESLINQRVRDSFALAIDYSDNVIGFKSNGDLTNNIIVSTEYGTEHDVTEVLIGDSSRATVFLIGTKGINANGNFTLMHSDTTLGETNHDVFKLSVEEVDYQ